MSAAHPPALCIIVHDVKNTRYYGTVNDDKLSLTRTADNTIVFRHQPLRTAGKYALTFTSRVNQITQFWYIANDLSAVPLPEDLSVELMKNPDMPVPLQCSPTGIKCVTVQLNGGKQAELKPSVQACSKEEVLFKDFDDLPESFRFKNVRNCDSKAVLGAVASMTPAAAKRMHLIVGCSIAAACVVSIVCIAVAVRRYKHRI